MNIETRLKAQALMLGLGQLTGEQPEIFEYEDHFTIKWKDEQIPNVVKWENDLIAKLMKKDGKVQEIQVDFMPVVNPIIKSKVLPPAIAGVIGLLLVGGFIGKNL